MRAHKKQLIEWILLVVFWLSVIPGWSQEKTPFAEENTYITVSGVVKDKQNRKTLEYVNVSVPGRSVGTVTNADGEFSLMERSFWRRICLFPGDYGNLR